MFEKILLPLDGSKTAEMALPYGQELAEKLGSELLLFHVCGPEHHQQQHMHEIYLNSLAESLKRNSGKGSTGGIKIATKIETGGPQENICTLVEKNHISLIVMTAIGASGLKIGKMIGSVADHVCRTVPAAVLLVKPGYPPLVEGKSHLINRILLTLDGSELSKLALPVAKELGLKLKVPITLFQMAQIVMPYSDDLAGGTMLNIKQLTDVALEQAESDLNKVETELKAKGLKANHAVVAGTSAPEDILDAVKKTGADLIVMSTHGRSGVTRWVLGNVAERVLRHADVPVLLVNARAS
jgi:nucleotide-binding universal stress UspA family protein